MNDTLDLMVTPEVLEGAADRMLDGRWCTGTLGSDSGAHCALGHIAVAAGAPASKGYDLQWPPLSREAYDVLEVKANYAGRFPTASNAVVNFNDSQRDKRKVARRLRKLASVLRKQGVKNTPSIPDFEGAQS